MINIDFRLYWNNFVKIHKMVMYKEKDFFFRILVYRSIFKKLINVIYLIRCKCVKVSFNEKYHFYHNNLLYSLLFKNFHNTLLHSMILFIWCRHLRKTV